MELCFAPFSMGEGMLKIWDMLKVIYLIEKG